MNGNTRQFCLVLFLTWLTGVTIVFFLAGPARADNRCGSAPPIDYRRQLEFRVTDLAEQPIPHVAVDLDLKWGDPVLPGWYVTNEKGLAQIPIKPVVENMTEGRHIRDRFLGYRIWLNYRIMKEGFVPHRGCIDDLQEYACFSDPLYQGLNKTPDEKPLVIPITLHAYCDYLACPSEKGKSKETGETKKTPCSHDSGRMKSLVEKLVKATPPKYSPLPGSIACLPDGGLKIGLIFEPLFDPSEMGLKAAARVLLKGPVRRTLQLIHQSFGPSRFTFYRIDVETAFQTRKSPHDIPAERTIQFTIPGFAAKRIIKSAPGGKIPCMDIEVTAGEIPIILTK